MATKKRIQHAEIVRLFAARLRELRHSRGLTQAELARQAHITTSYVTRLESGGAVAPGIDLVERLAKALATTISDLLPTTASPDTLELLRDRSQRLFSSILVSADRDFLLMLNPLLARLNESMNRSR
jgi:transcriptional regulator with XRE-family HTH domain